MDKDRFSRALDESGRLVLGGAMAAMVFYALIRWPGSIAFIRTLGIIGVLAGVIYWLDRESPDPPATISEESREKIQGWIREVVRDELDATELDGGD